MTAIVKRLRPLLISVVALMFTVGIAFAGKPSTPADGLTVASEHSGKTVPVVAEEGDEELSEPAEDEESDEDLDEPLEQEQPEDAGGENCATDPTGLSDADLALLRHGSVVCWAAHQETPAEFDNHGAFVSTWAKKNHGHASEHAHGNSAND